MKGVDSRSRGDIILGPLDQLVGEGVYGLRFGGESLREAEMAEVRRRDEFHLGTKKVALISDPEFRAEFETPDLKAVSGIWRMSRLFIFERPIQIPAASSDLASRICCRFMVMALSSS